MKNVIIGVIAVLVIGVGAYFVTVDISSEKNQDIIWPSGALVVDGSTSHDWGNINIKGGDVEHVFTLTNNSSDPVEVKTASTSCMCTNAFIEIEGEKSPTFGMHNNPSNWGRVVDAGETFSVRVVFDPMAHGPNAVGPIQRSIFLETSAVPDGSTTTSDSSTDGSILELRTAGDVQYEKDYVSSSPEDMYPIVMGDFRFKEKEVDLGIIKQSAGIQEYNFEFVYVGSQDVSVTGTPGSCACTTASVDNTELSNGDTGALKLTFDPNLHEEPEGKFFKTISILTDPAQNTSPELKMWAEIDLDLGADAYKLQEHVD